ncbi:MAG: hypothetical protein RL497_1556 [Pseudomonadota bacterium]|jgi:hypothetical protein
MKPLNILHKTLAAALLMGLASMGQAKTYVYDLANVNSFPGPVNYPGLDLFGAKSVVMTVNRTANNPEPEIRAMEITFPNAAKLRVGGFKRVDGNRYRALVGGAWVFKEVIVQLEGNPDLQVNTPAHISIMVSEQTSNLNPEALNQGTPLANVDGIVRDITALTTMDTAAATIDGKRVSLSLKDRLGVSSTNSGAQGFIVDTLWLGRGQRLMYVPAPFGPFDWDRIEPVGLVLEGASSDPMLRVRFRDGAAEVLTPPMPLRTLLQATFSAP